MAAREFATVQRILRIGRREPAQQVAALGGIFVAEGGDGKQQLRKGREQDAVVFGFLELLDAFVLVSGATQEPRRPVIKTTQPSGAVVRGGPVFPL